MEILVVDDDRETADLLGSVIESAGFLALVAYGAVSAIDLCATHAPGVAVVDLNLPPGDGFELVAELRRRAPMLPIIVLTGRSSEDDKVRALDLGADDYVVKPFGHRELIARIKAHARRGDPSRDAVAQTVLEVGPLRLDPLERTLVVYGEQLRLTANEMRLLHCLMVHSNSVVPSATLAREVWGYDDPATRDVVRTTVHRLRRKVRDDSPERRFIQTIPGVGLKLALTRERETERSL
jgi:DNA-binding response OmpR family regulator